MNEDVDLPTLPDDVARQLATELPKRGSKIASCVRTAAALISLAIREEQDGLRLAESGVYNLREALNAVVQDHEPVLGGLPLVVQAWDQYQQATLEPGADARRALHGFEEVLRGEAIRKGEQTAYDARLLTALRDRSGVGPLPGEFDVLELYRAVRKRANAGTHTEVGLGDAISIYVQTVGWFTRMFTPPSTQTRRILELAQAPWQAGHLEQLQNLVTSARQLRIFLSNLNDPAWIAPLRGANLLTAPAGNTDWDGAALLDSLGRTAPIEVGELLLALLAETRPQKGADQIGSRFQLLRLASQIGTAGHPVVSAVVRHHPKVRAVRSLAVYVAVNADPRDQVVCDVVDAVLEGAPNDRDDHADLLEALVTGTDRDNLASRLRALHPKVRRMSATTEIHYHLLEQARLTTVIGDDTRHFAMVSHFAARMLARSLELGKPAHEVLELAREVHGHLGERLSCRVLAELPPSWIDTKTAHVIRRLPSSPTGDDVDLVRSALKDGLTPESLDRWKSALGTPSVKPEESNAALPDDWVRAWRWSAVLPQDVLSEWTDAIARVVDVHGTFDPGCFNYRRARVEFGKVGSPHSPDELAGLPVLQAAQRVSEWRPTPEDSWRMVSGRELARSLQTAVERNPAAWTDDPIAVISALREPVHVLHYVRGITETAPTTVARAQDILAAVELALDRRWDPVILGDDTFDYEPDWDNVETAALNLTVAYANNDAELGRWATTAWTRAKHLLSLSADRHPRDYTFDNTDALNRAINNRRGIALETILLLAAWQHRTNQPDRFSLADELDRVLGVTGLNGMEYRAILARRRSLLEAIASDWLTTNADVLFGDTPEGQETFDLTIRYSRLTDWFAQTFREQLFAVARQGHDHAIRLVAIACLSNLDGYTPSTLITDLSNHPDALAEATNDIAFLAQHQDSAQEHVSTALAFWRALLDTQTPAATHALPQTGRWTFVNSIDEQTWSTNTLATLTQTSGVTTQAISVAERCNKTPSNPQTVLILELLLGNGEPWEQAAIERKAVETLHQLANHEPSQDAVRLSDKLLRRGHADADPWNRS